ncbi:MAG: lipid-A-disaccharide synthase [Paracoccaceae bacterium]
MRVYVIAGEPSGDRLGGALMAGLKTLVPDVQFHGIGGLDMQAEGLTSLFPMSELSIMGIAEVLPKYRHLMRRIEQTAQDVLETAPDVMITIDSPDFCLRVAKRVRAASAVRTVHYVAPSVWAWRPGRADKMAKVIDHVLALLPFEPPYMEAAGMECDFVGHPVVAEQQASEADELALRARFGLADAPVLLVLPGSRRVEVSRLAPIFGAALQPILEARPDMRVVVPAAEPVAELLPDLLADWPGTPVILNPCQTSIMDKRASFSTAEIGMAASGTVSLELAAAGTPMVIAYKPSWLSWQIAKRLVELDTVTLVNLVSDTRTVPEFLGPDCTPDQIADGLQQVMAAPQAQANAMADTMRALGKGGEAPGLRAARAVLDRLVAAQG